MTLRALALERALLRLHRDARLISARLKYEDKRSRRRRRSESALVAAVLQLWPLLPVFVLGAAHRMDATYAVAALYALGTSLLRASDLLNDLRYGRDLGVLGVLAAPDSLLFDRAWRRLVWMSLGTLPPFAVVAVMANTPAHRAWTAPIATMATVLAWGVVLTIAAVTAIVRAPRHAALAGGAIQLVVFGSIFVVDRIPATLPASAHALIRLTPGGWVVEALRACARSDLKDALLWLLLPVALLATLPWSWRQLRRQHRVAEIALAPMGYVTARFESEPEGQWMAPWEDVEVARPGPVAIDDPGPRAPATPQEVRASLRPTFEDSRGPVEHMARAVLDRRERILADFLLGQPLRWSVAWKMAAVAAIVGAALGTMPGMPGWLLVMSGLGVLVAVPVLGGRWPAFDLVPHGAAYSPRLAPYPVGFAELTRTILKINAVRMLAALPLVLLSGLALGRSLDMNMSDGFELGARIFLVLLAVQPVMVMVKFARGSNALEDSGTGLLVVMFLIPVGALFMAGVIAILSASRIAFVLGGFAVTATTAWILLLGYGLAHGRPWFDLIRRYPDDLSG